MLDQEPEITDDLTDDLPEADGAETELAPEPEAEGEIEIAFADDPAPEEEPADKPEETPLIRQLRQQLQEEAKAKKALAQQLAEKELAAQLPPPVEKPKRPTIADCDYDDAKLDAALTKYEADLADWVEKKGEREAAAKEKADALIAAHTDWTQRLGNYNSQKAQLPVTDFPKAEEAAKAALSLQQQSIIVRNIEKSAEFIYALGKNEAKLKELSAIKDADRFTAAVVRLEGKVKIERKGPPPPESKLPPARGGIMSNVSLDRLKKEAEQTGNYDRYFAAKRSLKSAKK